MAARKRHKSRKNPVLQYRQMSTEALYERIEASREAGKLTTAIDMAKECRRRASNPAHMELLGDLYIQRGRQLIDKHMHAEALMVLKNALSLGRGSAELLQMIFECGLQARQYTSAVTALSSLDEPSFRRRAQSLLVDEALVAGEMLERLCDPAIREGVQRIRRAYAALEQGNHEAANDELKPIGLSHPCAGWKWLLRGLGAYLRGEPERACASWERVVGSPRAGRLAELLRSALISDEEETSNDAGKRESTSALRARGIKHFENRRVSLLEQIKEAMADDHPKRLMKLCNELLTTHDMENRPAYARRLGRAICTFMAEDDERVYQFNSVFRKLPEDPLLLRAAAVTAEQEAPGDAVMLWKQFAERLDEVKAILPEQRDRARAMIWRRMGDQARRGDSIPGGYSDFYEYDRRPRACAVQCYRKSLKYDPSDLRTHEKLLDLMAEERDLQQAEREANAILERWPAHVSSLLLLGMAAMKRDAFRKALKFLNRARQSDPFDNRIPEQMRRCYLLSALRRLEQGKLDLARQDYEQAEPLSESGADRSLVYCKRAALEWLAGDAAQGEAYLERALSAGTAPVAVYLQLVVELERAGVPVEVRRRFEAALSAEWKCPATAEGAMSMVTLMRALDAEEIDYPSRQDHERALQDYLRTSCKKVTFSEEQMLEICKYLEEAEAWRTLETLAWQGAKRFRENYRFALFVGRSHAGRGARRMPRSTRRLLEKAGRQAVEADDLEALSEMAMLVSGNPRELGLPPAAQLLEMLEGVFEAEELEDEQTDTDAPDFMPSRSNRRRKDDRSQMMLFEEILNPDGES